MKLTDLNPKSGETDGKRTHVIFDCPKCRQHRMSIPFEGRVKWEKSGEDFETTMLSPSIAHNNGEGCESHFFIRNGEIVMA